VSVAWEGNNNVLSHISSFLLFLFLFYTHMKLMHSWKAGATAQENQVVTWSSTILGATHFTDLLFLFVK
jgi:hypothetical protein